MLPWIIEYFPISGFYAKIWVRKCKTDASSWEVKIVGLHPLDCWDWGFESRRGHRRLSLVSVVCREVEVSATSQSFVQRSITEWGVSECYRETSTMSSPGPTRGSNLKARVLFLPLLRGCEVSTSLWAKKVLAYCVR